MGIYASQKETIINSLEQLLDPVQKSVLQRASLDDFQKTTVTSVDTDPSKDEIINSLTNNEIKLIQGPPGYG